MVDGMLNTEFTSKFVKEGLTFDDVLLIPAESHVLPSQFRILKSDRRYPQAGLFPK